MLDQLCENIDRAHKTMGRLCTKIDADDREALRDAFFSLEIYAIWSTSYAIAGNADCLDWLSDKVRCLEWGCRGDYDTSVRTLDVEDMLNIIKGVLFNADPK